MNEVPPFLLQFLDRLRIAAGETAFGRSDSKERSEVLIQKSTQMVRKQVPIKIASWNLKKSKGFDAATADRLTWFWPKLKILARCIRVPFSLSSRFFGV